MKFLEGNKEHPSAEEIYESLSKDFPTMSVATVYNVLDFLKRIGKVKEVYIDPEKRRFDPDVSEHHHAICVKCNKVFDLNFKISLPDLSKHLPGFQIIDKYIKIRVLCPDCKKKEDLKIGYKEYQCSSCGSIRTAKHKPQRCPVCGTKGFIENKLIKSLGGQL